MRVLIVDDEPLAQRALVAVLRNRRDVETFDLAGDAVDALERLRTNHYDVMLLDINMPEVSGLEVLDSLSHENLPLPITVFVTAYGEHAIAAFDRHAVDYVLKPFSTARIGEALDSAARRLAGDQAARLVDILPTLQASLQREPARIAIKADGRVLFVDPRDVIAVQAEGNYVLLQLESGSYLLREPISAIAARLEPYGFIRIHRSVAVNAALVEEIKPFSPREYKLRTRGGRQYTVTRTYKKNLKALATFWIGTGKFPPD